METKVNCTVTEIYDQENTISDCLGISDDRHVFLIKQVMHKMIESERISQMLADLSKHCNHPNELAYVCYHLGVMVSRRSSGSESDLFKKIFGM